ncbi:hypothetical protein L1049_002256 [Liquidambar formosana]|uniref:Myb-like domain-containing protein n=1 Tax=Liquidambar formosana TaxID=63359 RepID=A0AAP0R988_LIQFO
MVHKRPFCDEDSCEVSFKHLKQGEHDNQLDSIVDVIPSNDTPPKPRTSDGEGEDSFCKSQIEGRIASDSVAEVMSGTEKESATSAPGKCSSLLWVSSSAIEEDVKSEPAFHLSFFPEFFEFGHRVRAFVQSDEIYSSLLDYPPRKLVSVGPDYQAYVPEWGLKGSKNFSDSLGKPDLHVASSKSSGSGLMDDDVNEERLMGTCVIPMPDLDMSAYSHSKSGEIRSDCSCLDEGSIRCVRQHVMEAREKLKENLGPKLFEELGFCDMGEEVAEKWNEEEEQAFYEVVLSNPASLGKNFWDHLSAVFPSRTKKDLVSYYFNVYMLRKRAEQNRFDLLNVDSDNDEWHITELGVAEEDDDSVVESPIAQDALLYDQADHEEDCSEDLEDEDEINNYKDDTDIVNSRHVTGEEDVGDVEDVLEASIGNSLGDSGFDQNIHLSGKIPCNNGEDNDIQDDSCTSFEYQHDRVDFCGPVDLGADAGESSKE